MQRLLPSCLPSTEELLNKGGWSHGGEHWVGQLGAGGVGLDARRWWGEVTGLGVANSQKGVSVWWKQPVFCHQTDLDWPMPAFLFRSCVIPSKDYGLRASVSPSAQWGQNFCYLGLLPGLDGIMSKLSSGVMYPRALITWSPHQPTIWWFGDKDWRKLPELNSIFLGLSTIVEHLGLTFLNFHGDLGLPWWLRW